MDLDDLRREVAARQTDVDLAYAAERRVHKDYDARKMALDALFAPKIGDARRTVRHAQADLDEAEDALDAALRAKEGV